MSVLALAGVPGSMTQTIDGGLVGVGAAQRASSIRWGIVRELLGSWLLTLPLAVLLAGGLGAGAWLVWRQLPVWFAAR